MRSPLPRTNVDLSARGDQWSDVAQFFEAVNRFAVIRTDRLHVAIAGCLLGKAVHLYPNVYFKNRATFQSSIEGYFDNVYFEEVLEL